MLTKGMIAAAIVLLAQAGVSAPAEMPRVSLPSSPALLRIAVTADTGRGADQVVRGMSVVQRELPIDAVIAAGDNVYPCGISGAQDPGWSRAEALGTLGVPVLAALGNHDYCGDAAMQVGATRVSHWTMPAKEFVVRNALADFVFLDSTPIALGQDKGGAAALRSGFARSRNRWKIVVSHHPPVSSGLHGRSRHDGLRAIRELSGVMRDLHVNLILSGHDHHEELVGWDPPVLITGAGSDPQRLASLREDTLWPKSVRAEPIAFSIVEIRPHSIRVRFYHSNGKPLSDWLDVAHR
jgi:tartrate-resistant acid phosphatase type 5